MLCLDGGPDPEAVAPRREPDPDRAAQRRPARGGRPRRGHDDPRRRRTGRDRHRAGRGSSQTGEVLGPAGDRQRPGRDDDRRPRLVDGRPGRRPRRGPPRDPQEPPSRGELDQADGDRRDDDRRPPGRPAAADHRGDGGRRRRGPQARASRWRPTPRAGSASSTPSLAGVDSVEHGHGGDQQTIEQMLERGSRSSRRSCRTAGSSSTASAAGIPAFVVEQCDALHQSLVVVPGAGHPGRASRSPPATTAAPRWCRSATWSASSSCIVRHGMTPQAALAQRHDRHRRAVRAAGRRPRRAGLRRGPAGARRRPAGVDLGAAFAAEYRSRRRGARAHDRAAAGEPGAPASMTKGERR